MAAVGSVLVWAGCFALTIGGIALMRQIYWSLVTVAVAGTVRGWIVEKSPSGGTRAVPRLAYRDRSGTEHEVKAIDFAFRNPPDASVADRPGTVRYLKGDPASAYLDEGAWSNWGIRIAFLLAGLLLIWLGNRLGG